MLVVVVAESENLNQIGGIEFAVQVRVADPRTSDGTDPEREVLAVNPSIVCQVEFVGELRRVGRHESLLAHAIDVADIQDSVAVIVTVNADGR